MKKYTEINRAACKELRDELETALAKFGEDRGIKIEIGNGSFDSNHVKFAVNLSVAGHDPRRAEFERNAFAYGLEPEDFGREFTALGKTFTICGLKPRARRLPILADSRDGKRYKFESYTVRHALGRN